jgi:hypothetical protein
VKSSEEGVTSYHASAHSEGAGGTSDASITVGSLRDHMIRRRMKDGTDLDPIPYRNAARVDVTIDLALNDRPPPIRSVDACAAAEIPEVKVFRFQPDGTLGPQILNTRLMMAHGYLGQENDKEIVRGKDPVYFTVTDLESGDEWSDLIVNTEYAQYDGGVLADDLGVRLTVNKHEPAAYASIAYTSELSAWVLDGFSYRAALTPSGLSVSGQFILSDWVVTETADTITAVYSYGDLGPLWDTVSIRPPDELFTAGRTYGYGLGGDGAGYLAVPSPGAFGLIGVAMGLITAGSRRRARE